MYKMYDELADWWILISTLENYIDEVEMIKDILKDIGLSPAPSLFELGSAGGSHAYYLKRSFSTVLLSDLAPQILDISRTLNPDCEHLEGDMRTMRLGRVFDVVLVHNAVNYMTTLDELRQAMETAFVHCRDGGVTLFMPDHIRDTFEPSTNNGGMDGEKRAVRYLEWKYDPDITDTTITVEYVYVLREEGKPIRVEHETHIVGLFSESDWLHLLREVGFQAELIRDESERDIFVARKPKI
jgi:trans-aconitate methyltransferase